MADVDCEHKKLVNLEGPAKALPGGEGILFVCKDCGGPAYNMEALIRLRVALQQATERADAAEAALAAED